MATGKQRAVQEAWALARGLVRCAVVIALVAAGPALADNADLAAGMKALQAGKAEPAIKSLSKVITGKAIAATDIAHAYYYRGLAYRKAGKQTPAIADFTNALWLKGLTPEERQDATYNRGLAYQAVGLGDQAARDFASAGKAPQGGTVASAAPVPSAQPAADTAPDASADQTKTSPAGGWQTNIAATSSVSSSDAAATQAAATPPVQQSSGGGLGSLFDGSLFSASGSAGSAPAATASFTPASDHQSASAGPVVAQAETGTSQPSTAVQSSGVVQSPAAWSTDVNASTQPAAAQGQGSTSGGLGGFFNALFGGAAASPPADQTSSTSAPAAAPEAGWQNSVAAPSPAATGYHLQLASLRSETEAAQFVGSLRQSEPELVQSYQAQVTPQLLGNMGTFYNVLLGPFPDERTSLKVCNDLQRRGHDCFLVAK